LGGKTVLSSRRLDARSHNLYPVTRIPYTEPGDATRPISGTHRSKRASLCCRSCHAPAGRIRSGSCRSR
jgi:hypothetical protein